MEINISFYIMMFACIILASSISKLLQNIAKWGFKKGTELISSLWLYVIASEVILVWELLYLTEKYTWSIGELFLVLLGPCLISLAALKLSVRSEKQCTKEHYLERSTVFYIIIAIVQLWIIIADFSFHCFTLVRLGTFISMVISIALVFTKSHRWHISGTVALWLTLLYNTLLLD